MEIQIKMEHNKMTNVCWKVLSFSAESEENKLIF